MAVGDVVGKLEELTAEAVSGVAVGAVDIASQQVEARGVGDEVGRSLSSAVVTGGDTPAVDEAEADSGVGGRHCEGVAADGVVAAVVVAVADGVARGAGIGQRDGGIGSIVGDVVNHYALAAGGNVGRQGKGVEAAGTGLVAIGTDSYINGIGCAVHRAVEVVVGRVGAIIVFFSDDGTHVVVAAHVGTDGKTVLNYAIVVLAYDTAICIATRQSVGDAEGGGTGAVENLI